MTFNKTIKIPQCIDLEPTLEDNMKDDIEGLEKWFNDNLSKLNDKQDNVFLFVQGKIKKIKAEAIEKNTKIEDPSLNQAILNKMLYDNGFFNIISKFLTK